MDKHEAGKQKAVEFVTDVARSLKKEGSVDTLLWWPEVQPEPDSEGSPGDTTVPLRIYQGSSWRSIGFARSDIDGSVDDPRILTKYEGEIARSLSEL